MVTLAVVTTVYNGQLANNPWYSKQILALLCGQLVLVSCHGQA